MFWWWRFYRWVDLIYDVIGVWVRFDYGTRWGAVYIGGFEYADYCCSDDASGHDGWDRHIGGVGIDGYGEGGRE